MSLILTHGYFIEEDALEQQIMRPYPPLGLLYISGYLKERQIDHHVFDSTFSNFNSLKQYVQLHAPKVLAIYTNLMTKINVIKLMKWAKQQTGLVGMKIVLGGPDVSFNVSHYLEAGADFIVIGEGEETFTALYTALCNGEEVTPIEGIAYLKHGEVITHPPRTKIKDLSALPMPNRAAVDLSLYQKAWRKHHGYSTLNISTQRGCPYTCKWCSTAVYGKSYRRRPAHLVADEVAAVMTNYAPDSLWFVDDVFTVSHKWLAALHHEFMARQIHVPFEIITRAERLNKAVLTQLREMGCKKIWIGAESGSQRIIDKMDRRVNLSTVVEMMQLTQQMGMETGTFVMVGYPTETVDDILQTVTYLKQASPDSFTITKAYPIKGTALYKEIEETITTQNNWETSTDRQIDFERTYAPNFYKYAIRFLVNEVNSSKALRQNQWWKFPPLKTKAFVAKSLMKWHR